MVPRYAAHQNLQRCCLGETGRAPLLLEITKLAVDYFGRTSSMDDSIIAKKAFLEQESLNLCSTVKNLTNHYGEGRSSRVSVKVHFNAKQSFIKHWECGKA